MATQEQILFFAPRGPLGRLRTRVLLSRATYITGWDNPRPKARSVGRAGRHRRPTDRAPTEPRPARASIMVGNGRPRSRCVTAGWSCVCLETGPTAAQRASAYLLESRDRPGAGRLPSRSPSANAASSPSIATAARTHQADAALRGGDQRRHRLHAAAGATAALGGHQHPLILSDLLSTRSRLVWGRESELRTPVLSVPCCSGDNRLCDARDHATTVDVCVGALVVL